MDKWTRWLMIMHKAVHPRYLSFALFSFATVEHESDGYTNCNWCCFAVTKGLVKGLEDLEIRRRVETILTVALLRLARILRKVLETCFLDFSQRPSANANMKNSKGLKWSYPDEELAPTATHRWSSYWNGRLWSLLTTVANFTFYLLLINCIHLTVYRQIISDA